jgi:ketosteroid isomerase-like protein
MPVPETMRRIAVILALLLASCATARTDDAERAMRDWLDALNALDEARIVAAFAEDATAFFPVVKAERVDGKDAIAAIFHDYVAGSKKTNIVPEDLRVQQSGDVAIVTFNVHNPSAVSRRTFVWRRDARGWRIVHLHASNTPVR